MRPATRSTPGARAPAVTVVNRPSSISTSTSSWTAPSTHARSKTYDAASPATGDVTDGVTGTVGTIATPDGNKQLTINGMPVYYYAKDTAAGDILGQGVGSVTKRQSVAELVRQLRAEYDEALAAPIFDGQALANLRG